MSRGFVIGAAVALGTVMLVPGVAKALGRAGKPLARAAMRTGTVAHDEFRAAAAETYEHIEDIVTEVREEMAETRATDLDDAVAEAAGDGD